MSENALQSEFEDGVLLTAKMYVGGNALFNGVTHLSVYPQLQKN